MIIQNENDRFLYLRFLVQTPIFCLKCADEFVKRNYLTCETQWRELCDKSGHKLLSNGLWKQWQAVCAYNF